MTEVDTLRGQWPDYRTLGLELTLINSCYSQSLCTQRGAWEGTEEAAYSWIPTELQLHRVMSTACHLPKFPSGAERRCWQHRALRKYNKRTLNDTAVLFMEPKMVKGVVI